MSQVDNTLLDELAKIIRNLINEEFKKLLNDTNVEFVSEGIISAKNVDSVTQEVTYNVELAFTTAEGLKNLTGVTLNVKDRVKVFYNKFDMSGAYIGVKVYNEVN